VPYETLQGHLAVLDAAGGEIAFEAGRQLIIGGLEEKLQKPAAPRRSLGEQPTAGSRNGSRPRPRES
jgi:hypothetical protein